MSWLIGATGLIGFLLWAMSKEVSLNYVFSGSQAVWSLALAAVPVVLLGYFAGMFFVWPFMRTFCSRINGSPLLIGDTVEILTGPDRGRIATVYETPIGQGGWQLARLDFGDERRANFKDIFETYQLLNKKANRVPVTDSD
ncbi:MAG: hypothetical protein HC841_06325 [Verrucomicrobiae bacterium]|nr:hypothetical protein [Verrucomicrobiae bacterium]